MELLTKELKAKMPALYSTESMTSKTPVCKFFNPCGAGTWYVIEGEEQENGDWRFFGLVDLLDKEWGYFNLKDLESVQTFGLGIERDLYYQPESLEM